MINTYRFTASQVHVNVRRHELMERNLVHVINDLDRVHHQSAFLLKDSHWAHDLDIDSFSIFPPEKSEHCLSVYKSTVKWHVLVSFATRLGLLIESNLVRVSPNTDINLTSSIVKGVLDDR
jgi:hypothetical protein